jgi:HSP20 family protein
MIRWGRFGDIWSVKDAMEQLLAERAAAQTQPPGAEAGRFLIPIDVWQTAEDVIVRAAIPGVRPESLEITCEDGLLTIRAHTEVDSHNYYAQEIAHGDFSRRIALPAECRPQDAWADFSNGIVTMQIPKVQATRSRAVKVAVSSGGDATIRMEKNSPVVDIVKGEGYRNTDENPRPVVRSRRKGP